MAWRWWCGAHACRRCAARPLCSWPCDTLASVTGWLHKLDDVTDQWGQGPLRDYMTEEERASVQAAPAKAYSRFMSWATRRAHPHAHTQPAPVESTSADHVDVVAAAGREDDAGTEGAGAPAASTLSIPDERDGGSTGESGSERPTPASSGGGPADSARDAAGSDASQDVAASSDETPVASDAAVPTRWWHEEVPWGEHYVVQWETKLLISLGHALSSMAISEVKGFAVRGSWSLLAAHAMRSRPARETLGERGGESHCAGRAGHGRGMALHAGQGGGRD